MFIPFIDNTNDVKRCIYNFFYTVSIFQFLGPHPANVNCASCSAPRSLATPVPTCYHLSLFPNLNALHSSFSTVLFSFPHFCSFWAMLGASSWLSASKSILARGTQWDLGDRSGSFLGPTAPTPIYYFSITSAFEPQNDKRVWSWARENSEPTL